MDDALYTFATDHPLLGLSHILVKTGKIYDIKNNLDGRTPRANQRVLPTSFC